MFKFKQISKKEEEKYVVYFLGLYNFSADDDLRIRKSISITPSACSKE